jgi:uncharacterized membrane protein
MADKIKISNKIQLPDHVFFRLDAQYRLTISLAVAIIAFFCAHNSFSAPSTILIVWISFAMSIIIMDWIIVLKAHPREIRKIASLQDSSRTLIFLFVIVASVISLGAILLLLKSTKGHDSANVTGHILLAISSVFVSWWLVHTLFALRYAHMYYDTDTDDGKTKPFGGLQFPDENEPDYLDFVYFAFVIGMTFQVSDVEISARDIRRLALMHGLISFIFNTAIVALSINIISSLIG